MIIYKSFTIFIKAWWPTLLVTATVLWLTLARHPLPEEASSIMLFEHADKIVHAVMMGGLAATALFDMWRRHHMLATRTILFVCIAVAVFSCLDEWAQSLTGRTSDIADAVADLTGIAIVTVLAILKFSAPGK